MLRPVLQVVCEGILQYWQMGGGGLDGGGVSPNPVSNFKNGHVACHCR